MVSLVVHGLACFGIYFAVHHSYRLAPTEPLQRYVVRMLELSPIQPPPQPQPPTPRPIQDNAKPTTREAMAQPSRDAPLQKSEEAEDTAAPEALAASRLPKDALAQQHALQTMIVPDTAKQMLMTRPLPQVVIWNAQDQKINVIIPPPPQPPMEALIASLSPPNQEMHIADLKLSATAFPALKPLPAPSNTAPISSPTPEQVQQMQISIALAKRAGPPTSTDVIVASTVELQSGVTAVPLFNAVAPAADAGPIHPGGEKGRASEGTGVAIVAKNGAGDGTGNRRPSAASPSAHSAGDLAAGAKGAAAGSHKGDGSKVAAAAATGSGGPGFVVHGGDVALAELAANDLDAAPLPRSLMRVTLPKDGKFGMVVIGNSAADDYPETVNIWRSRLAYSVYLQVGSPQKWILQYALPSSADATPAVGPSRLEAPWPYDISRPSIDTDAQADAIIVHGLLTATGHLERMAVVFPAQLSEAAFLLHALDLWNFRPALSNGQPSAVEVLLIIPPAAE